MAKKQTSLKLKTMNFIVGAALLVMFFPHGDRMPEKPTGVRTAIELIGKKQSALGPSRPTAMLA